MIRTILIVPLLILVISCSKKDDPQSSGQAIKIAPPTAPECKVDSIWQLQSTQNSLLISNEFDNEGLILKSTEHLRDFYTEYLAHDAFGNGTIWKTYVANNLIGRGFAEYIAYQLPIKDSIIAGYDTKVTKYIYDNKYRVLSRQYFTNGVLEVEHTYSNRQEDQFRNIIREDLKIKTVLNPSNNQYVTYERSFIAYDKMTYEKKVSTQGGDYNYSKTWTYDENLRVNGLKEYDGSGTLMREFTNYKYDEKGNLLSKDLLDANGALLSKESYSYECFGS